MSITPLPALVKSFWGYGVLRSLLRMLWADPDSVFMAHSRWYSRPVRCWGSRPDFLDTCPLSSHLGLGSTFLNEPFPTWVGGWGGETAMSHIFPTSPHLRTTWERNGQCLYMLTAELTPRRRPLDTIKFLGCPIHVYLPKVTSHTLQRDARQLLAPALNIPQD